MADITFNSPAVLLTTTTRRLASREEKEWAWLAFILLLFVSLNVFTADRYPFPFFDEVLYADPAVNYVTGHGFTVSPPGQDSLVFYFYNGPAHSALLIPWLKVFGISMRSVRSINFAYMAIAVLFIWSAVKRMGLVRSTRWRLLLILMVMCDYAVIFSYRCGRYDCLGMLIVAFAFWAFSFESMPLRLLALTIAGAASPWIGLQLLPLEAVLGGTLLAFTYFRYWREMFVFFSGVAAGGLGLIEFYYKHDVLQYFLRFPVFNHADLNHILHSQSKGFGFVSGLLQGEFRHSNLLPKDFSLPFVFGCAVLLAVALYKHRSLRLRSLLIYGLIFTPLFGLTLILLAKFPTYYGWMTYVPLSICVCGSLGEVASIRVGNIAVSLCVIASIVGVGLHVLACARDWNDRDYSKVQQFVIANVHPDDWVYIDPQAYYPAKLNGAETFFANVASMPPTQKDRVTVCLIEPAAKSVLQSLGGAWYKTGQEMIPAHTGLFGTDNQWGFLSLPNYRLSVYRRVPIASSSSLAQCASAVTTKSASSVACGAGGL
jgi:hypothetical protein